MTPFSFKTDFSLSGEDLTLLRGVLDAWLREKGVAMGSEEAAYAGLLIAEWFQLGIRNPSQFRSLLEPQ
ncbi:hypothetical protein HX900_33460 [Rhizobium sp. WYCCWR 11290]|uniref:Uncharacterized protein n=1 Tax=Rhizobium changzhiense TaxID=2692317 RepID=A0A7Z0ZW03_9HYPH|nr:hypothetical protein [Rhizobium changzhiense]NZD65978.1 hypothetical protein [Rhizobium changzhiense]